MGPTPPAVLPPVECPGHWWFRCQETSVPVTSSVLGATSVLGAISVLGATSVPVTAHSTLSLVSPVQFTQYVHHRPIHQTLNWRCVGRSVLDGAAWLIDWDGQLV